MKTALLLNAAVVASTTLVSAAGAQSLVPLTSFGGGDGWRAPNEVLTGDALGTQTGGTYNFLQTGGLERGLAFNPATGNLILVSRSGLTGGATNIRVLNGTTGVDLSGLNTTGISGGTFVQNMVGVGGDGQIYVGNLTTNTQAGTSPFRLYRYSDSLAATTPTVVFSSLIPFNGITSGTPRGGDSLDVIGAGADTRVAIGYSGVVGYAIINPTAGSVQGFNTFSPSGPSSGDFRLGITFAGNDSTVWGKQTGGTAAAAPLRQTTYSGTSASTTGSATLLSGGEMAMDYAIVDDLPLLATLDANSSIVRVYDVTTPTAPVLLASATSTSGTLAANANATGSIAFGAISGQTATIYAMSTNQGIQALILTIPEPATLGVLAGVGAVLLRRKCR